MDKFRQQWSHIHRIWNLLLRKGGYAPSTRCALTTITWCNYMMYWNKKKHYTDELSLLTTLLSQNKRLRSFILYIRGSFHKQVTKHHSVNFQNMKICIYMFCKEFNWEHILEFLRWLCHYCDVTCTKNAVSQCSILPSSFLLQLASVEQHCELNSGRVNKPVWLSHIVYTDEKNIFFVIQITEANKGDFAVFCQNFVQKFLTKQKLLKFPGIPDPELRLPQFPGIPDREILMALQACTSGRINHTGPTWHQLFSTALHTLLIADTSCNYVMLSLSSCQRTPGVSCISDFAHLISLIFYTVV